LAGLIGELTFEAYAWLSAHDPFGVKLEPANLVIGPSSKKLGSVHLPYAPAFAMPLPDRAFGIWAAWFFLTKRVTKLGFLGCRRPCGYCVVVCWPKGVLGHR